MKILFYRIGYGLVFVIFNIRVMVDLLPNTIGYLMILSALSELRKKERSFNLGMWSAAVLSVISIPNFFQVNELNLNQPALSLNYLLILSLAENLMQWVLMYSICEGCFKLAAIRGKGDLASSIRFRWRFYFGCSALYMIAYPFILNTQVIGVILFSSVAMFIAFFMIILIVRRAGRELSIPFERRV